MSVSDHFTAPRMQGLAGTESAKRATTFLFKNFDLLVTYNSLLTWNLAS